MFDDAREGDWRNVMARTLREGDWDLLLRRIRKGECTPFLGAGACAGVLPTASEIAGEWASRFEYPLSDSQDLVSVAQFLAVEFRDARFPKELIKEKCEAVSPNFALPDEIHSVLAELPLPMYITTNYDNYMTQALTLNKLGKKPEQELCRWNEKIIKQPSIFEKEPDFVASPERPVVFHFHGHTAITESMVLTEDDYLDFLLSLAQDSSILKRIEQAFMETSLLFLGYRLADWNFRVVFRSLVSYLKRSYARAHVSVQLAPDGIPEDRKQKALDYLDSYFGSQYNLTVYWGTCQEFATELRKRM